MAIKIECSNCGHQNDLGRVFCVQCGQKLDLHATSMQELDDRREFDFSKLFKGLLVAVVVLAFGGILGAAFWQVQKPIVQLEVAGVTQVPIKARAVLQAISYHRSVTLDLTERELNGFLAERAKIRKLRDLTIDLKTGTFELYAALNWCPATNVSFLASVNLPVTLGMRGSFKDGKLMVEQARVGHLVLPGSARKAVVDYFADVFKDVTGEQRFVSSLKPVAIEESTAHLPLGP